MQQAVCALGYEVRRENGDLRLINRETWPRTYYTSIFLSSAALCVVLGFLIAEGVVTHAQVTPAFLFAAAVGLAVIPLLSRIMFRRPRSVPPPRGPEELIIDPAAGELRTRDGEVVAPLRSVRVTVCTDWWWTWGVTRFVLLSWEGGRRIVFRSASRRKPDEVVKMLADVGARTS